NSGSATSARNAGTASRTISRRCPCWGTGAVGSPGVLTRVSVSGLLLGLLALVDGLRGDGVALAGVEAAGAAAVRDRDLARLGLLGHRDGQGDDTVGVVGRDAVQRHALAQGELAGEGAGGTLVREPLHVLRGVVPLGADRHGAVVHVDVDGRG